MDGWIVDGKKRKKKNRKIEKRGRINYPPLFLIVITKQLITVIFYIIFIVIIINIIKRYK